MHLQLIWDTIDRLNINTFDNRSGNLHMAHNQKAQADIQNRFEQLSKLGAPVELISNEKYHYLTGQLKSINQSIAN